MDKCEFNCFEDIMKACGYSFDEDGNIEFCNTDNENFEYGIGCGDIAGGFQHVYPELFILIGEVIGAIVSQRLPINVQNAFGNWLQLVGQAILTYNAQQQYYQGGPGHYFDPRNYDIANSYDENYCRNSNKEEYSRDGEYKEGGRTKHGRNKKSSRSKGEINDIEKEVKYLKKQIREMQSEINNMKNNG
ncbi:MAG: hypothetical protein ACI398_04505 [Clostridium sp.]